LGAQKDKRMKILLAIDDSEFSRAAVSTVIREFRPTAAEVHVLHVIEPLRLAPPLVGSGVGPSVPGDFIGVVEGWLDKAESLLSQTAGRLESAGFRVTTSVNEGDARTQILDFAEKWKPNLIVVGSHGRRGLDRFLLGSVSEAVAHHAHCSVQIVRPSGTLGPPDTAPGAEA
jgi:nucleotide-binding universal stress UspA family protein